MSKPSPDQKVVVSNRKAFHHYSIEDRYEAGIVLRGSEVKALREGKAILQHAFGDVRGEEVFLVGLHIPEYAQGSIGNHDPDRDRKLLLHRREIGRLLGKVAERGLTLIPLRLYFKGGRAKCELGLARGKKLHDKRASIRERDAKREMAKEARARQRA